MATLDTIRRLTIQYQSVGGDAVKRELDSVIAAQKASGTSADGASKSVLSLEKQVKALERAIDPAARAQQAFQKQTGLVSSALAQGAISTERASQIMGILNGRMVDTAGSQMKAAQSTGLMSHEMKNLGFQLNDVLTMLAMGSSPFQVMASQGGQVYQVLAGSQAGLTGAIKELGSRFVGLVGPAGLAGAAITGVAVAGFAAWSSFQDKVTQTTIALNGAGRAAGVSVDGLMAISARGASRGGVSNAAGVSLGAGFASAGVGGGMIEDLIASTRAFSKAFGLDLQEAGKELAASFADPSKGADELNKRFGFLSADLQTQIQRQQASGNIEGARQTLQEAYNRALAETTTRTNVLSTAFEALKNSASNAWSRLGQSLSASTPQQNLEGALGRQVRRGVMTRDPERRQELIGQQIMAAWEAALNEAGKAIMGATDKVANDLSLQATEIARRFVPGESRNGLIDQRDVLQNALGDPAVLEKMKMSSEQAREALLRLNTALDNFKTPLERMVEDGVLAFAAASASTAQQRLAVDMQRTYTETLRSTHDPVQALTAAQNAYKVAVADSQRTLEAAARSAKDNLALSGLNPYQRAHRQVDFDMRDLRERTLGSGAPLNVTAGSPAIAQAATQLANGFNTIFHQKITELQAAFPELRMTSGVRTEEEQRTLRALYGPNGAAAPGNSRHEVGLAADFSGRNLSEDRRAAVIAEAQRLGLVVIPSNNGAMHVEGPRSWAGQGGAAAGAGATAAPGASPALASIEAAKRASIEQEMFGNVMRASNNEIEKQQRALAAQTATFGRSTGEVVAAAKAEEMLLQFKQQGVPLDAERIQQINETAAAYGRQAQAAEDAARAQQRTIQTLDAVREFGTSAFSGVATAIMQGKSASEAFNQALQRLSSRMFDILGNQLMEALLGKIGTGGGGLFGSVFGQLLGGSGGVSPISLGGGYTSSLYDVGGVVGAGGGRTGGMMPASLWNGAPHFDKGGRVGARPIIAHDGEIILNAAQQRNTAAAMRSAAAPANNNRGGATSVVVNNYSDANVETRTSEDSGGNRMVELVLTKVRQDYATGGFDSVNRSRFGRSPRGIAR